MKLDYAALEALAAVLATGSFDQAARLLGLTQPAISQRIRALEERVGTALVQRGRPSTATKAGARLLRHAEEVGLLEKSLIDDLGGCAPGQDRPVRLAINADSLATWVLPALNDVSGFLYELIVDDQDHSADWLKRGEVSAAITSSPAPVPGCDSFPLGALPYAATCAPAFFEKHFQAGLTVEALSSAPCLTFNRKDGLQARWAKQATGKSIPLPCHFLPSSHGFITAAKLGLGWGMNPIALARDSLAEGSLIELLPDIQTTTPLYWQVSRQVAKPLAPLTLALRRRAKRMLLRAD